MLSHKSFFSLRPPTIDAPYNAVHQKSALCLKCGFGSVGGTEFKVLLPQQFVKQLVRYADQQKQNVVICLQLSNFYWLIKLL